MSTPLAAEKASGRTRARALLAQISPAEFSAMGSAMQQRLCATGLWQNSDSVFCFYSAPREADTLPLLCAALADGKKLYLPRCLPGRPGEMEAVRVEHIAQISRPVRGLWEPDGDQIAAPREISLALIPCLAATRRGERLGHGGGYYDRFLEQFRGLSVLVCPHALVLDSLPLESHDRSTDFVLTERGLWQTGLLA